MIARYKIKAFLYGSSMGLYISCLLGGTYLAITGDVQQASLVFVIGLVNRINAYAWE